MVMNCVFLYVCIVNREHEFSYVIINKLCIIHEWRNAYIYQASFICFSRIYTRELSKCLCLVLSVIFFCSDVLLIEIIESDSDNKIIIIKWQWALYGRGEKKGFLIFLNIRLLNEMKTAFFLSVSLHWPSWKVNAALSKESKYRYL